jgi:hypothetical protein
MVSSFLPYPLRCTRFSATARPRRRDSVKHGGGVLREREGPRLNLASPKSTRVRAGVHGIAGVELVKRRVRAQARTRTRPARRGVVDSIGIARRTRRHRKARLRKQRTLTKAAAPARSCIPAWHEGRHHQRRRGGAVRSTPARWPGNHKREAAVVLTSVATGRSAGRRCSVAVWLAGEEEEEVGGGASSGK